MPESIVCTRAIKGGSFSSGPRLTRLRTVFKLSNVKRIGVAPRAGRVGLPESVPAKAVSVDCGARFLKAHPTTNPVVDPISYDYYIGHSVFLEVPTFIRSNHRNRNQTDQQVAKPLQFYREITLNHHVARPSNQWPRYRPSIKRRIPAAH